MRSWRYLAYDGAGRRQAGVILAETEAHAADQLRRRGLHPAELADAGGAARRSLRRRGRISPDLRAVYLRQMAVLLAAGLPAEAALEALRAPGALPALETMAAQARAALLDGAPLSEALGRADPGLPRHIAAALRAGESGGALAQVFEDLATYQETAGAERAQIATALIYPGFVAAVSLLVCGILMTTVAPEIVTMFEVTGRPLPEITRIMLGLTRWISGHVPGLGIGAGLAVVALLAARRNARIRAAWLALMLRLPLVGRLIRLEAAAQYLRTLALITGSRQTVLAATQSAAEVLRAPRFHAEADRVTEAVRAGESLSQALRHLSPIPAVARQLVDAGEQAARLGPMTARAAHLVEGWLASERKRLAALLDPALMMIVGVMVLVIVLSVLLPIFDLQAAF